MITIQCGAARRSIGRLALRLATLGDQLTSALPLLFILIALPTLACFINLVPFGEVADEPAQSLRADALLFGEPVGHRIQQVSPQGETLIVAGVDADPALLAVAITPQAGNRTATAAQLAAARAQNWTGATQFMEISPLAVYAPVFYLPGAAGLGIAHLAGFPPLRSAKLARLINALTYILLGATALRLARRGQALMFGVLLVPMSLNLAASLSQDGLIIATSTLAAALLSRVWSPARPGDRLTSSQARLLGAIALGLVALVKPPYAALGLCWLLPMPALGIPSGRQSFIRRALLIAAVTLPAIAWFGWTSLHVAAPSYFGAPRLVGPLLAGPHPATLDHADPALQLRVLAQNPIRLITLPLQTVHWASLIREMIGNLGWLDVTLPNSLYQFWTLAALAAALAALLAPAAQTHLRRRVADAAIILAAVFLTFIAIYISQYLVWTTVGQTTIDGPQGRYFLPLIPFMALALPGLTSRAATASAWLTIFVALPAIAGLFTLPYFLAMTYYLH